MRKIVAIVGILVYCSLVGSASAALVTYNSGYNDQNASARNGWLGAIGITDPQYRVDFESGFLDGQNVSNQVGLFPGRLLVRDTSTRNRALIESGPGSIALSNPVGKYALTWEGNLFEYLELDFSGAPVDYVGWQDIDTTSNNSLISIYFVDGTYQNFRPDSTYETGDSAEFLGFFRSDLPLIRKVRLNLSGDLYGIDNIEYGNVPIADSLPGDFNADGAVDAADYALWRKVATGESEASRLAAGVDDYDNWRANFGSSLNAKASGSDGLSGSAAVPEPSVFALILVGVAWAQFMFRRTTSTGR